MLTVYHSNQLGALKTLIAALIEHRPLADPFAKEVILVQSHGMAQWLQIELAQQFGIAANIDFPLPASFIWQMFTQVLPGIPKESAFSKDAMGWKLMHLLPEMIVQPAFAPLKNYLDDDTDKRKLYQLATRVADLFDQYLVYRPEWLSKWQRHERVDGLDNAQEWQAPLWQALTQYVDELKQPSWHRANLYQRFIETLNNAELPLKGLPERVFICGISALPPVYLQALQALGRHIDIHLMFTNPCRYYWGDIQDYAFLARLKSRWRHHPNLDQNLSLFRDPEQADELFDEQGVQQLSNPLLASWGKLGRDNIYLMSELTNFQEEAFFVEPASDRLLQRVQRDILLLEDRALVADTPESLFRSQTKQPLDPQDRSLTLHLCHSAQREVEVLYDNLLAMLDNDPQLTLRDIIVMVADIDQYAPYIQSVFSHAPDNRHLPFAISDRRASETHPILKSFLTLLNLPQSRFTAEDILTLLEVPALADRFSIDEEGLRLLRHWVESSGIRWGLDDEMVESLELPATGLNTWRFGLTRMLLGYAMNSQQGDYAGVLPYDESSGLIASLAGELAEFITQLTIWRQALMQSMSLTDWAPLCRQMLDTFFVRDTETDPVLNLIEQQWQQVIACGLEAGYHQDVPLVIIFDELSDRLQNERISQRFLAGPINFCTLMPMRSIPFKVVCLLGMNDGVYPRTMPPLGFDLMANQSQRGDRSRRDDDRYLFLEALLSAQQSLYISYIGQSIQDNSQRYPSVLITELLEYISQSHVLPGDEKLDIDQSAAKVLAHLVCQHSRVPFSDENFVQGSEWQSYASEWLAAAVRQGDEITTFEQPLQPKVLEHIELDDLRRFLRHPVKGFFQQRLQVYFSLMDTELPDEEPFQLDGLTRYRLNDMLLESLIDNEDEQRLFNQFKTAGELPYAAFGELFWQQQRNEMSELADSVKADKKLSSSLEFEHKIAGVTLSGWLHQVQDDGILRWRPARLSAVDGLILWLDHLLYCVAGHRGESRIYGRDNTHWRFASLDKERAETELAILVQAYITGLHRPLLLLPKGGWAWLSACYNAELGDIDWQHEIQQKAKLRFIDAWQGSHIVKGEKDDPYLMRLYRVLNDELYEKMITDSSPYLLTLMKHNLG